MGARRNFRGGGGGQAQKGHPYGENSCKKTPHMVKSFTFIFMQKLRFPIVSVDECL